MNHRSNATTATSFRSGFTLIELMLAMGLSIVIIGTAFSAVRMVSQSTAIANRLSQENALMRAGFLAASDELDFWRTYDDPLDPSGQRLRGAGKPFCPMSYDPTRPDGDPRRWWRGYGSTLSGTVNSTTWGDYSLLSKDGHTDPMRAWLPTQTRTMLQTIGRYGAIGYLPGNAIFSYYDATGTLTATPKDVWAFTEGVVYTADPAKAYNQGALMPMLLPSHPATWPGLAVETRRYVVYSHNLDTCLVTVTSPMSGEAIRFAFWGVGTTLRGARQQRNLDTVAIR